MNRGRIIRSILAGFFSKQVRQNSEIQIAQPASLNPIIVRDFGEYTVFSESQRVDDTRRRKHELDLLDDTRSIRFPAWCAVCDKLSTFRLDFRYSNPREKVGGQRIPNWRERLQCTRCGLNCRTRSAIHFLREQLGATPEHHLYATEQLTLLFRQLKTVYPRLVGSEYLGDRLPRGGIDPSSGVRNESLVKLSFTDESFDFILSFDVMEHIPRYLDAFRECLRCLKPGGTLLFSVPFDCNAEHNLVRARIDAAGDIEHIESPEYHGDPVRDEGCLCFYHFGWRLLDELRAIGYATAQAHFIWSVELAYLGNGQVLFTATRPV